MSAFPVKASNHGPHLEFDRSLSIKKPYLHKTGETAELRIPLTKEQTDLFGRIVKAVTTPKSYVAEYFAKPSLSTLESFFEDDNISYAPPAWLITDSDANLVEIFAMFDRFCDEGWIPREHLESYRRETTIEYVQAFELTPEEMAVALPVLADACAVPPNQNSQSQADTKTLGRIA